MTFKQQLEHRIRKTVHTLRRDGTVAMSLANLHQVVTPPPNTAEGAPKGAAEYRTLFYEVAKGCAASFLNGMPWNL